MLRFFISLHACPMSGGFICASMLNKFIFCPGYSEMKLLQMVNFIRWMNISYINYLNDFNLLINNLNNQCLIFSLLIC